MLFVSIGRFISMTRFVTSTRLHVLVDVCFVGPMFEHVTSPRPMKTNSIEFRMLRHRVFLVKNKKKKNEAKMKQRNMPFIKSFLLVFFQKNILMNFSVRRNPVFQPGIWTKNYVGKYLSSWRQYTWLLFAYCVSQWVKVWKWCSPFLYIKENVFMYVNASEW